MWFKDVVRMSFIIIFTIPKAMKKGDYYSKAVLMMRISFLLDDLGVNGLSDWFWIKFQKYKEKHNLEIMKLL